jgi:hypothetical protein
MIPHLSTLAHYLVLESYNLGSVNLSLILVIDIIGLDEDLCEAFRIGIGLSLSSLCLVSPAGSSH